MVCYYRYHPLKHDASPLYTEVLFNQVAPDYLEGLLLRLGNPNLPPSVVRDMALVAALLHRYQLSTTCLIVSLKNRANLQSCGLSPHS